MHIHKQAPVLHYRNGSIPLRHPLTVQVALAHGDVWEDDLGRVGGPHQSDLGAVLPDGQVQALPLREWGGKGAGRQGLHLKMGDTPHGPPTMAQGPPSVAAGRCGVQEACMPLPKAARRRGGMRAATHATWSSTAQRGGAPAGSVQRWAVPGRPACPQPATQVSLRRAGLQSMCIAAQLPVAAAWAQAMRNAHMACSQCLGRAAKRQPAGLTLG